MNSAPDNIGGLFITTYSGAAPSKEFLEFVRRQRPAGVILFADNCADHEGTRGTIEEIQGILDGTALIAVDQEGGRICRVRGVPAEFAPAREFARAAGQGAEEREAALQNYRRALGDSLRYLRTLGFNYWLGPVCDLELYKGETALEGRTFGPDPALAAAFTAASVETAHACGFVCAAKHAPGLGRVSVDPHFTLGISPMTIEQFENNDATPFRAALDAGADSIMTSHFICPEFDERPVTFSPAIVKELIKKRLSETAAVITDDLEMGALAEFGSAGEVCARALAAGHDLLLTRSQATAEAGIAEIRRLLGEGSLGDARVTAALQRVATLRGVAQQRQAAPL
ncbi:MAG TPA: glycoside hydrolase family 3 N-terminal domain-containing protein [candidate division Zixibacteria bacterium]|nr:glycoside hydrolase family 3 N-terminal domain-containing protein [candidate division Zixibacteria bacterium]